MVDMTIIYYTSNREDERFEKKVQQTLLKAVGDLPIISVSQKPIDFGDNICVGDIGASVENILFQMREGALSATTKFISTAEDDCLYHRSYFDFEPEREDVIYRSDELYIVWIEKPKKYYRKRRKDVSGIVGRKHFINVINQILANPYDHISNVVGNYTKSAMFHSLIPMVSFKTRNGLHYGSSIRRKENITDLPHWGLAKDLVEEYYGFL